MVIFLKFKKFCGNLADSCGSWRLQKWNFFWPIKLLLCLRRWHSVLHYKNERANVTTNLHKEYKAGFTPEGKQNANGACENDANVWWVHLYIVRHSSRQRIDRLPRLLNVSYAISLWSTDSWWIAFDCLPNVHCAAERCLLVMGNNRLLEKID